MTPEEQRIDEQVKYMADQREKKKAREAAAMEAEKNKSGWQKFVESWTSTPKAKSKINNDPLGRNLTQAEILARAARGEK